MFVIDKNNKIVLTKGDNAEIDIRVFNLDGTEYHIQETDEITLTVRKNAASPQVAFTQAAYINTIYIEPSHTSSLTPGLYVYDIQLTNSDGEISTIIPTSFFEIVEEITR